jgi:hypothetical protein
LARVAPSCGRRPCILGDSYGDSQWQKMLFCCVIESVIVFFSYWYDVCWRRWDDLLLVDFSFLFFFLFSLSSLKNYKFVLFVFNILTSILILLISDYCSWSFYKNFIYFQFHHSILIFHILFSQFLLIFFFNFLHWPFCKSFIGFQLYHSIQIYSILFFQFGSHSFDFFFVLLLK